MAVLLPFLAAFVVALGLTPLVRKQARLRGLVASPRGDRWHRRPTALFGGIAIFGAFLAAVVAVAALEPAGGETSLAARAGIGIVAAATIMFFTGLVDDRWGLRPASKLVLQGLAAAVLISFDVVYPVTAWAPVNIVATIFWFIALTNALNLLDNMDGVAAGIAGIAAAFLTLTFAWEGEWLLAGVCAGLAGSTFGFLPYNWHPASIFMGDSGSLFMGALLAGLGVAYPGTASQSIVPVLLVPAVIVAIPILDTALVTVTRTLAGRSPSTGGRDHTTHRLVAMGLSEPQAALLLYGLAVVGGGVALTAWLADAAFGLWSIALFAVVLVILGGYLARLHTYVPGENGARGRVTVLVSDLLYKRRALEVVLDLVLFAVAYYGAYLLRWDGAIPPIQERLMESTLAIAVASQSVAFGLLGVYRGVWHQMTIVDAHRIAKATALGTILTVVAVVFVYRDAEFARGVFVIQGLLVALVAIGARSSIRSLDLVRSSLRPEGARTLIYGAGKGGELVHRELLANPELRLQAVGFLDDDNNKKGRVVRGLRVYAGLDRVEAVAKQLQIEKIVLATKKVGSERRQELARRCDELGLTLLELEVTLKESAVSEIESNTHTDVASWVS